MVSEEMHWRLRYTQLLPEVGSGKNYFSSLQNDKESENFLVVTAFQLNVPKSI